MLSFVSVGLLGLLSLSIPVGIVLFLLGFGIDQFFSAFPLTRGLGSMVWSTSENAALIAVLRTAGRDPGSHRHCRTHLLGARPLGLLAARRAGACQCGNRHHVLGHVRIFRGNGCHGGDGGHAAG